MRLIAFYGKGGAGKSTVVSNLSACFSTSDKKVLHIGCDPKHDSTRSLIHSRAPITAVDLFMKKNANKITDDELVMKGFAGIDCIEVGGPEPGAGCAGLGIIKTMELIQTLKLLERPYDYVLFDVLGDVVCGGFATPMRMKFAEEVFVVLSSEMMSMYAANNICRGIVRYAKNGKIRLGGFIGNQRSPQADMSILYAFAERLGSNLAHLVPWDESISISEREKKTVLEHAPDTSIADSFRELASKIEKGTDLAIPTPMSDEEFENFFLSGGK